MHEISGRDPDEVRQGERASEAQHLSMNGPSGSPTSRPEPALELAFRWIARLPDGRDPTTATCAYVPADVYEQIAEALEAVDDREKWLRQRWSYQNRAEVAERGHKAALARDSQQRDEIKKLRAALELIYTKTRDRHAAAVAWEALRRAKK